MYLSSTFLQGCGVLLILTYAGVRWAEGTSSLEEGSSLMMRQAGDGLPLSPDNCPVLKNATCTKGDKPAAQDTCKCPGLVKDSSVPAKKYRKGEYSCPDSTCKYCAQRFGNCLIDGFKFPCCEPTKYECLEATKFYNFSCFAPCSSRLKYKTCSDSAGRNFSSHYKSCKGKKANTFVECPDTGTDVKPKECGATGGECDFFAKKDDGCCSEFRCTDTGKCEAECKAEDTECKTRDRKGRCGKNAKFVPCKDSSGRSFSAQYLGCTGKEKEAKNFLECAGGGTSVRECGATGAVCKVTPEDSYADTCCTNFVCLQGKCKPECAPDAKNCTVNTSKKACAVADSVKTMPCTVNKVKYTARYTKCSGSKPNTLMECVDDYAKKIRECGVTGAVCNTTEKIDFCCINFKCNYESQKCEPECPKDKTPCTITYGSKNRCSNDHPFQNCTVDGKVYSARYLDCSPVPSDKTLIYECPKQQDYERPHICAVSKVKGGPCKETNYIDVGSCCTNFKCDAKNETCIPIFSSSHS